MDLKEKIKREAEFMKLGAKVLPKIVGQKAKQGLKNYWENVKEQARLQREAEAEAKRTEKEAYKEELLKQARIRGQAKARQRVKEGSAGGILAQLGQAGERMSVGSILGIDTDKQGKSSIGQSPLFEGLGQPQPKKTTKREVHHYHHYPKKKRRH